MTNPNPLYPKLLDILRVSLVEFGDKATPELRGRTFIDGIFLYHGANKSGAKIIAILTPEGLRIPVPLPAIAKISIIGRSPSGDFIEDLGIRADAPFRLVNFYGMNPDIKPPPNQPPYIPPKDAYTIVSDVNTDTKTVTFDFPETDIEPITISVASGLPDDVPFLFLENLETLDIGGEDYADEGIDEVIELEEEGAYGTIVVQNQVQVAEEEKIYGDDFQENDMLNDILSNEIEREPELAERLVRTLATLKKNLRIPTKRFYKIRAVNDAVHPALRAGDAEIPNWIVPVLRNRRRLYDIDPAIDEMVAEGEIDGTYDSVTTAGELEGIRGEIGGAGSRSGEMAALYGTRGNAQEPNFGGTDGRTRQVIFGVETGELINVAATGEKDNDHAVLVPKTQAKIALRNLPEGGKRGLTVGGAIVYPAKSIPQRVGVADLQNLVEWGAETPVGQSNRDRINAATVESGEVESYLENRIRNARELEIGDYVRVCLAPVYANRREGLIFRGIVDRVVGGGGVRDSGTIYVRPTGAIDVGLTGDRVLEIPVADAEIVKIRDLTSVHCETAKGVRPLQLQAGRGRLTDIGVARMVAPNLRQVLQTQDAYSLRATGVSGVIDKLYAHAIDPRGLTHQELAEVGVVAKANIAAYIELLGEIRKMVSGGAADAAIVAGNSDLVERLPPADLYSILKRLDRMTDRWDYLRRQLDGGAYIWLRECLRDLGERRLVLEALTKDIMSNREEIGVRLAEIRENKKRMSEAARSGMIDGLNLVKTYTSMKSLNKDSLSRNDILIDKNYDDTNRGLWMMIREDNPDIKDREQLLKILRAFLRDIYPDEVGADGSIPEDRIADHIRGGKRVKDGDHAILVRDLTTRVFVQEGGRWSEVSGEFGGVNSVVPKSVSNLTDFVRNGVHIKETEGVLTAEHERLRRMENDLELHQITATVIANQAKNFDRANAEMDDAADRARRMNVFAPDLKDPKWIGYRTTAVDKVTVVELDDEEIFVDQEDFDAPMRVAFSDQDVSDLANRLGLDYGDALPGEEMEKATVDLATMTPRQLFWFEMYAKVGNFTGVHLSKDGVVEYLEIVSVMEALKPSTYRTAKDAKTRVRSAQFDVMTACAAVLLAGQIHQETTRVDVGTLNAFPLRQDREDDMGAVQVFATKMSLSKEQLEGLRGNSGIMLRNAHQIPFRPENIQSGILTLVRSLLGGNSLFQMRLRESEARLLRKEGGVAGEVDYGAAKDDTKNALPPLNVEAKVSAPVKGKIGTPIRSRVGYLMKVYESIALNVEGQEPILMTRMGVPYEENGFQMKSGADVGMLELKNLNASVLDELRELDAEFKKLSNSVVDAHGGRRPLILSELTTDELSSEKIANYFVETLGNPLLSRDDNLKLLRRSGVEPNEKSLWAILDRGAKVQVSAPVDVAGAVDVARWALVADAEEIFGTQGRVIDGDVGERLELCVNNRVVDDVVFGTFLYILSRSEWQANRGSRSRDVPVLPPQDMVELAEPHKNLLGRIQENLVRIYETELPVIEDVDTRGEFFALVHSRLGKQVEARRKSRVEGIGSITISFIQDLLGATDGEGEDEVRVVNLDAVEFIYVVLKLALGVTPIDGFDLIEGVVRATEPLEELEVRIRKEREDERNLFIQRIHQLEGNEAREVDKIMKDLRLGRWAVRGKVGYDPEQVAREMIEAEAFGRDLQEGLGMRAQMREDAERNEFVVQTGDDVED